jgi:hypothetical protein
VHRATFGRATNLLGCPFWRQSNFQQDSQKNRRAFSVSCCVPVLQIKKNFKPFSRRADSPIQFYFIISQPRSQQQAGIQDLLHFGPCGATIVALPGGPAAASQCTAIDLAPLVDLGIPNSRIHRGCCIASFAGSVPQSPHQQGSHSRHAEPRIYSVLADRIHRSSSELRMAFSAGQTVCCAYELD